ncbi:MAG: hypothetical protein J0H99_02930, partial [Rhodospirillales bacterium]|nr:hypothetical protein [Rhodospirillales bacterium]
MPVVINIGSNTYTFSTVDTLTSGGTDDSVTFTGALTNTSLDFAAGSDVLTLANVANSLSVKNVETISGGTGADTLTLGTSLSTSMTVDLGTGNDTLTLGNAANTGSITGVE